ncbi:phage antirepressor KilAC domain-containing protein [Pseudomonas sp. 21LCFQ010]|uniref:phage antirepressor KilAC domain-containing protein n=1 Tax=Pseudomonas sp. 21LCFQ010 TaxID=2957506 RepID=UPI0020969AE3|nr:phage antirepressor KilAC domain-containing protein [Pseudomonas sp. 21LCFQ010]MCO8164819.1 phage antirepressor KilAC domain-containing protein [Pseudomonas sp. 21LCFQ010]
MDSTLAKAATHLGLSRPQLIRQMRDKGLLTTDNLPAHPNRDRDYLHVKEGHWWHPQLGMQYSRSTRVTPAGIRWLAVQLGIELAPVPPDNRHVA